MNPFFRVEGGERLLDGPQRVYARFEQLEEDVELVENDAMLLSAVDGDWWDEAETSEMRAFEQAPLSMLSWRRGDAEKFGWKPPEGEAPEEQFWLELEIDDSGDLPVTVAASLFDAGQPRYIRNARHVDSAQLSRLRRATSLDAVSLADPSDIHRALQVGHTDRGCGVAIYDVGQGNCNAVFGFDGKPLLYFDFGGGVTWNARTFPTALKRFCFSHDPPVVLSHWDWDHWSSAVRDPRATHRRWIVPNQRFGSIHAAMAANIAENGALLVWPEGVVAIAGPLVDVVKCNGEPRNHNGLAMYAKDPQGYGAPILLTGDADYAAVPRAQSLNLGGLVASHHGGRMRHPSVPRATTTGLERVVYSYGPGNSYNHAFPQTRQNHHNGGWTMSLDTGSNATPRPSHAAIGWEPLPLGIGCPDCDLQIAQT